MRLLISLVLATGLMTLVQADADKPIAAADAEGAIGKPRVVVEMTVKQAKDRLERRGIVYLDSEDDFNDAKNLGVAISAEAAEKFGKQGVKELEGHFKGKTIRVTGCVMRFEERVYLPVHDPGQIEVVEQ
jgi:hypothetical protein